MKQIFINIPVNDLEKSVQFFLALGFTINPLFTDEHQKCMIWSDVIYLMLQSKQFFGSYINKPFTDTQKYQSISHTLPVESIQRVNDMIEHGVKFGGKETVPALQEGFMYLRSIEDVDGYVWGIMYLDLDQFKALKRK